MALKSATICLLLVFLVVAAHGQKQPIKFGDIPMEDIKMTVYAKDSSAVAIVLADFGESTMDYSTEKGFSLNFERITRIKIIKKEGFEWGNFSVPLYHNGGNYEKLLGLKAVTYNLEDGKVVETKVKNESIFKEKFDENYDITKVALPKVKEGSVVEISYRITSDFISHFQDWDFQYTIPVRMSEYRAKIPEYFFYEKYMQGYIPLSVNESTSGTSSIMFTSMGRSDDRAIGSKIENDKVEFQEQRFRWVMNDVPAFKEEPYLTTYKDYISRIKFELSYTKFPDQAMKYYMGSWKEINDRYVESEDFGGVIKSNGHLKDKTLEIIAGATTAEEKISLIHQYVRDNFQWDGTTRKFVNTPIRKVVDEKKGSSAEINLILASMLEKADIEVYPVLISTRDHGFVREELPISTQFNHTICLAKVGDKPVLLDATQKLLPTGFLPERCLNGKGLIISKAGHAWVTLTSPVKSKTTISGDLTMSDNANFTGKLTIDRTGYHAEQERKKYFSKGEADYVKAFVDNKVWELSKSSFENTKLLASPLKEIHELKIGEHATVSGERIYFNPFFVDPLDENPFKSETREYPVDFGSPFDQVHIYKITLPAGYDVEEIPASKALALPNSGGKYLFNVNKNNGIIMITSSLQINRPLFIQDEYKALREFYAQVVAKQAEQIVLKKK
jgi:Domain of Unknown Function with PDB structure (DUF3857)